VLRRLTATRRTTHRPRPAALLALLLAALGLPLSAPAASEKNPVTEKKAPSLQQTVASLVAAYEASQKARAGVSVVDLATGQATAAMRSDTPFIPASNQKLLTASFALLRLGETFEFVTQVCLLEGKHLLVMGSYDPTLGDPILATAAGKSIYLELDRWAAAVRKAVGGRLPGDVLLMTRPEGPPLRHPDWLKSQYGDWYAAPVAMLNFHNNCFDVTFRVDKGRAAGIVSPASRYISITNRLQTGKKHIWSLISAADDSAVTLRGTVLRSTNEPVSVAAKHPPLLLGRVLADRLARAGVTVAGTIRTIPRDKVDITKAHLIAETRTPLSVALARANKRSLNMTAECILLRAGDGTWAGGAKLMTDRLRQWFALPEGSFVIRDGSGLSRKNKISPAAMTTLLTNMVGRSEGGALLRSLAVAGVDGTLKGRMTDPACRGRVLGKSGYVAKVSALSGYVLDDKGRPAAAFSILVNDVPGGKGWIAKKLQDDICRAVLQHSTAGNR